MLGHVWTGKNHGFCRGFLEFLPKNPRFSPCFSRGRSGALEAAPLLAEALEKVAEGQRKTLGQAWDFPGFSNGFST